MDYLCEVRNRTILQISNTEKELLRYRILELEAEVVILKKCGKSRVSEVFASGFSTRNIA